MLEDSMEWMTVALKTFIGISFLLIKVKGTPRSSAIYWTLYFIKLVSLFKYNMYLGSLILMVTATSAGRSLSRWIVRFFIYHEIVGCNKEKLKGQSCKHFGFVFQYDNRVRTLSSWPNYERVLYLFKVWLRVHMRLSM